MRSETFALGIRTVSGNIKIERLGGRCIAISMKKSTWNKNFIKLTRMVNTFIFMTTPETRHRFVIPDTQKFIFGYQIHNESPVCMQITHKKSSAWILWTSYPLNHFPFLM